MDRESHDVSATVITKTKRRTDYNNQTLDFAAAPIHEQRGASEKPGQKFRQQPDLSPRGCRSRGQGSESLLYLFQPLEPLYAVS